MKKLLLLIWLLPLAAFADSEVLSCGGTVTTEWTDVGGSGCTIVNDAVDANYIETTVDNEVQRYSQSNTGNVWTSVDSVVVTWRAGRKSLTKAGPLQLYTFSGGSSYNTTLYNPTVDYDVTWEDSTWVMTTQPAGGAWDGTAVDDIEIAIVAGDIGGGGGVGLTEYSVTVWGVAEASSAVGKVIIIGDIFNEKIHTRNLSFGKLGSFCDW